MKISIPKDKLTDLGVLVASAVLILIPLFNTSFFPMHDYTHAARITELDRGILSGQFPARWSDNFGWGHGMPLLHFYAPLFYYVAEVLYRIGLPVTVAIKIVIFLSTLLGLWGAYKLGQAFFGKIGAYIVAIAFGFAPYRAVQLYVRGSLTEYLATSFIPLALWGIYCLIKNSRKKLKLNEILLTAVVLTGVFLSHNVITLLASIIFTLWAVFWTIYYAVREKTIKIFLRSTVRGLFSVSIAMLLSAWFLVPAFFEKGYTIVDSISGGYSYYKLHFVYIRQFFDPSFDYGGSVLGPEDDISFQLGLVQIGLLFAAYGLFFIRCFLRKVKEACSLLPVFAISSFLLAGCLFLMTHHSEFIWEAMPFLHITQFPWRFLSFAIVFVSLPLGAMSIGLIKWHKPIKLLYWLSLLLIIAGNIFFFRPQSYIEPDTLFYTDKNRIQEQMSGVLKDYLPKTAVEEVQDRSWSITIDGMNYEPVHSVTRNGYRRFTVDSETGGRLIYPLFDFIGWQVRLDGMPVDHTFDKDTGFIAFNLLPGVHTVELVMQKTPLQKWSDGVSFAAWILVGIYGLVVLIRKKTQVQV